MSAPILGDSCSATQSKKINPPSFIITILHINKHSTRTLSPYPHMCCQGKHKSRGTKAVSQKATQKPSTHTWSLFVGRSISSPKYTCVALGSQTRESLPDFWETKKETDTETEIWCAGLEGNLQATRNATTNLRNDFTHATGQTPSVNLLVRVYM